MSRISFLFFVLFLGITLFLFPILPGPLAVRHADAASITLAWDPNSEPDIAGYKLYYGIGIPSYEFAIDVGNQTTYTIPGFLEGTDYHFAVTAYNVYGLESSFSDEVSHPGPPVVTISLSAGMNFISLPIEPLDPSIAALTGQLSPCLRQVQTYVDNTSVSYDPFQPDQSTLSTMEPGKGYWVQMACPGEMTVVGNRTTNPIILTVGGNYIGYNGLTPLPVSEALTGIANKYTKVWAYKGDRGIFNKWIFYDPHYENASALKVLSPGGGFYIEATEETIWTLPYIVTISLSAGMNFISLPIEPLDPSIAALTGQLSPC
ncbi:MAG: fibronectin type III domain-containing protein, partial [Deltaproteobacteria bacterium]|nr:fibronectin type III domain-containing protein [Deltaproteobacteria bacterium]